MSDTTIKVDSEVRDRLAQLAGERGLTIRDLVSQIATETPTRADLGQQTAAAAGYVAKRLVPGFGPDDVAAGDRMWEDIAAGRLPGAPVADSGRAAPTGGEAA
jgi:antitoxin MazE7